MIRTILFAADLGAFTAHGLAHTENLAKKLDASINIVHAVPPLGELACAVLRSHCSDAVKKEVLKTTHVAGLLDTLREQIFEMLLQDPFDASGLAARVSDIKVVAGQPAAVILSEAEQSEADMIVVGSHGIDSLDSRLLGSVAGKVLQLSKTPVYMVPMMNTAHIAGMQARAANRQYRL